MWEKKFMAPVGDKLLPVQVYEDKGGKSFSILMNNFYMGVIIWGRFGWKAYASSDNSWLQGDEVTIILDIIETEYPSAHRKVTLLSPYHSRYPRLRGPLDANRNRLDISACNVYLGRKNGEQ